MKTLKTLLAAVTAVALLAVLPARAEFPEKPIEFVIPFGAGGGADIEGRLLAKEMSKILGQPVVAGDEDGTIARGEREPVIAGQEVRIRSPLHAVGLGIGMIHQHFMLVDSLTVTENVILPLGMQRTTFDIDRLTADPDHLTPYRKTGDGPEATAAPRGEDDAGH